MLQMKHTRVLLAIALLGCLVAKVHSTDIEALIHHNGSKNTSYGEVSPTSISVPSYRQRLRAKIIKIFYNSHIRTILKNSR
jgi:hypothetical protein